MAMNKYEKTYVNPMPLPDYPIGRFSIMNGYDYNWRETADPTVLYENGKWYLYSSCGIVYWSEDFCTWNHKRIEPYDCGYAPTVVNHRGKYYLCGSLSDLYVSDDLLEDYHSIGRFTLPNGEELQRCYDPMLFSDDDGRLYLYYSTGAPIVLAVELDADNPTQLLSEPELAIEFDPAHEWERNGEYNEDKISCALEGPWMLKKNGVYYLVYCAPGTEYSTYGLGAYKSSTPLGPWEYMKTNPFTRKTDGVVRGPGHGCITEGPDGNLWVFYTCTVCYLDAMERRIGFDPVYINDEGDLVCPVISESPRWAPGVVADPFKDGDAGLVCVTGRRRAYASSCAPGRDALYATDEDLMSWWQPADDDECPTLIIPMSYWGADCAAVRIIWRDVGLSLEKGALPGPIKYKLELRYNDHTTEEEDPWITVVDRSESEEDLIIDYRTFEVTRANEARLTILGAPKGITPAVMNISVFGEK